MFNKQIGISYEIRLKKALNFLSKMEFSFLSN